MSVLSFPYYEESIIELLDPVLTEVSHSILFLCDECESECVSDEIHFCGSCTRHLCSDCFLSDFDSLCYDCLTEQQND